ncbi:MBOAT family O-acyltransferase [Neolewinella sp.]|uniref:MBOAT family O-acyltransferase n=1 Tax=Neolewinella sp. TaxID=2993543 RepID=UPI003B51E37C
MLFSSLLFLWLALPVVWGGSILLPGRWQNAWLLLTSLLIYTWGGVGYTSILLLSIGGNYLIGRRLPHRGWLTCGVLFNLLLLGVFKYANFFVREASDLLQLVQLPAFELPRIALPLGISFYTFQAISYLVDVQRRTVSPQRSLPRLGLFISFFPQLIAGPIVRYHEIDAQIAHRTRSWDQTSYGLQRFLIGLTKKVLIANTLAGVTEEIFALDFTTLDTFTAWAGALLYAGQIYYDFSGYSDMAIGLALLFGFRLPENFDFPYTSRSIREFWRRWHITLGAWFRDYLYIPLGGSRRHTRRNLLIVFVATGVWHGAAWSFLLWGLWHGLFIVLERQRWWPFHHWVYAFLVVLLGWVLFRTESVILSLQYYRAMLGFNPGATPFDWSFYWTRELTVVSLVAVFFASKLPLHLKVHARQLTGGAAGATLYVLALILLFVLCTNSLVNNSLNPFIYFRF